MSSQSGFGPLPGDESATPEGQAGLITVRTDVLELQISTRGGTFVRATLLDYPIHKDEPDKLVQLLSPERSNLGLIRTGLRSATGASADQDTLFSSPRSEYVLGDAEELAVPLTWTDESGVTVEKTFHFTRGSYAIDVEQTLINNSGQPWRGDQYTQLLRRSKGIDRSMFDVDTYSFDGPVVYDGDGSKKLKRDDLLDEAYTRHGVFPTLLERDFNIPPLAELLTEVDRIVSHQNRFQEANGANVA